MLLLLIVDEGRFLHTFYFQHPHPNKDSRWLLLPLPSRHPRYYVPRICYPGKKHVGLLAEEKSVYRNRNIRRWVITENYRTQAQLLGLGQKNGNTVVNPTAKRTQINIQLHLFSTLKSVIGYFLFRLTSLATGWCPRYEAATPLSQFRNKWLKCLQMAEQLD